MNEGEMGFNPTPVENTASSEPQMEKPWWEGSGKAWKQSFIASISNIATGEELLQQYPDLNSDALMTIKSNLLKRDNTKWSAGNRCSDWSIR